MRDMIATLYEYNCRANERILAQAESLSADQLMAASSRSHGSLHGLLYHMARTEWLWRNLAETRRLPGPPPAISDFPDVAALRAFWQAEQQAMRSFLAGLSQDDLSQVLELADPRGGTQTFIRWQLLMHLLLHSMQHRSEAATVLTELGRSPGDLDFIFFAMELNRSR